MVEIATNWSWISFVLGALASTVAIIVFGVVNWRSGE